MQQPTIAELELLLNLQIQQTQKLQKEALEIAAENQRQQEIHEQEASRASLREKLVVLYAKMQCSNAAETDYTSTDVHASIEYVFHTSNMQELRKLYLYVHPDRGCSTEESQIWVPVLKQTLETIRYPCVENVRSLTETLYSLLDTPFPGFDQCKHTQSIEAWLKSLPKPADEGYIPEIDPPSVAGSRTASNNSVDSSGGNVDESVARIMTTLPPLPPLRFTTTLEDEAAKNSKAAKVPEIEYTNVRLKMTKKTQQLQPPLQTPIAKSSTSVDRMRRPCQFLNKDIRRKGDWSSREWALMKMPMACFFCCENGIKCTDVLSKWTAQGKDWKQTRKDLILAGYYQFACGECMRDPRNFNGFHGFPFFENPRSRKWKNFHWSAHKFAIVDEKTGAALARVNREYRKALGTEETLHYCRNELGIPLKDYKDGWH